jgi:hypothetical protein
VVVVAGGDGDDTFSGQSSMGLRARSTTIAFHHGSSLERCRLPGDPDAVAVADNDNEQDSPSLECRCWWLQMQL